MPDIKPVNPNTWENQSYNFERNMKKFFDFKIIRT